MIYLYLFGTCFHFIYVFMIIGNKVRVGAGSVLMRKTKDGNLYIGNPAKLFKY